MHRQSLGSPSSKLPVLNIEHNLITTTETHNQIHPSSSISAINGSLLYADQEYCKEEKQDLIKKLKLKPKSYIHLIPMLTLLCFLILYLSSHHPSINDMAEFNGLKGFANPRDLGDNNILELEGIMEIKKGSILGIRSLKNLDGHLHRKLAPF